VTFPQQVPTVSKLQLIMDFITALGWNETQETAWPLFPGPEVLSSPDRMITITPTPGPGFITEEAALDCWGFQALVRGASDDPLGPGLVAAQLDVLILNGPYPQTVDGIVISMVARAGATPTPLPLPPDDRRFEYTTTYLITTGGE
jgi:hypothetical protein